jgi:single-stranded DNA-binding protein
MKILSDQPNPQCPAPRSCLQQRAARKPRAVPTTGAAVVNLRIASTERFKGEGGWQDSDTLFMTVTAWRALAENLAESASKGTRVI